MRDILREKMILISILLSESAGVIGTFIMIGRVDADELVGGTLLGLMFGGIAVFPAALTVMELVLIVRGVKYPELAWQGKVVDAFVFTLGGIETIFYAVMMGVRFNADWTETLINSERHTPIFTQTYPTIIAIAAIALIGYLVLNYIPVGRLAPLVIVCSMAAMYLGAAVCVLWSVQICTDIEHLPLCLAPFNFILITVRTVQNKVLEWNPDTARNRKYRYGWLDRCNGILVKATRWPVAAFFLMFPLLGILICLLALFGQEPDAVIKAWAQSSDWNLSQRVAPQNIYVDEHYLCTVAAGGHKKVVKPLRLGVRHGHPVIVNRQLCIANAFEQILEEKTPRLHRRVRCFYDTYGFPVARAIHSPYIADAVYFLMKPLEWFFLIVIYCCDVNPENRIAVQYMGAVRPPVKRDI